MTELVTELPTTAATARCRRGNAPRAHRRTVRRPSIVKTFGAKDGESLKLRTHCQTSGWSLAAQAPYDNAVRTCLEVLAAVLGAAPPRHPSHAWHPPS